MLKLKNFIKKIFFKMGVKVVKINSDFIVKHDPYLVQKRILNSNVKEPIIFDVGSFHGHVARKYRKLFPKSSIYCFEPFPDSFNVLKRNLGSDPSFKIFQIGVSDEIGKTLFNSNSFSQTNSILKTDSRGESTWGAGLLDTKDIIEIEISTIDQIVLDLGLEKIDILKMDVQGAEFKVLKGAEKSFKKGIINMIYSEIITMPTYEGQLELEDSLQLFKSIGFKLVGLYNYSYSDIGNLRQVDALFIKKQCV